MKSNSLCVRNRKTLADRKRRKEERFMKERNRGRHKRNVPPKEDVQKIKEI
jgi:hypothetical protein